MVEDCETGVLTKTRRGTKEMDQKLQGHPADISDVEVVRCKIVRLEKKENLRAGRNYTWEEKKASAASTCKLC